MRERVPAIHPAGGESRTKQADAKAADINNIVEKWMRTGIPPQGDKVARYGDFSNADDYFTCVLRVKEAEEAFMNLSARVRDYCDQSVGKFLELVEDPSRREEMEELGLVKRQVPARPSTDGEPAEAVVETPEDPA